MGGERRADAEPVLLSDESAWNQVYRQTHQRLVRLAVSRGVDFDSAHDLAQDAFRLLLERRSVVANPESWLVRVVQRRSCDFWRQRDIEARALSKLADPQESRSVADPIRRRRLAVALNSLPPKSRRLIRSRYFDGQDETTAAREAGYSPASFKKVMTRALALLRRALRHAPQTDLQAGAVASSSTRASKAST